jgi:hypothetical protein
MGHVPTNNHSERTNRFTALHYPLIHHAYKIGNARNPVK